MPWHCSSSSNFGGGGGEGGAAAAAAPPARAASEAAVGGRVCTGDEHEASEGNRKESEGIREIRGLHGEHGARERQRDIREISGDRGRSGEIGGDHTCTASTRPASGSATWRRSSSRGSAAATEYTTSGRTLSPGAAARIGRRPASSCCAGRSASACAAAPEVRAGAAPGWSASDARTAAASAALSRWRRPTTLPSAGPPRTKSVSETCRGNQRQADAIRGNQTQSDAIRRRPAEAERQAVQGRRSHGRPSKAVEGRGRPWKAVDGRGRDVGGHGRSWTVVESCGRPAHRGGRERRGTRRAILERGVDRLNRHLPWKVRRRSVGGPWKVRGRPWKAMEGRGRCDRLDGDLLPVRRQWLERSSQLLELRLPLPILIELRLLERSTRRRRGGGGGAAVAAFHLELV